MGSDEYRDGMMSDEAPDSREVRTSENASELQARLDELLRKGTLDYLDLDEEDEEELPLFGVFSRLFDDRPSRPRTRRTRGGRYIKTLTLTLFVVVLIIASAVVFQDNSLNRDQSATYPGIREGNEFIYPPFTDRVTVERIPGAPLGTGVTLELEPVPDGEPLTKQEVYAKCSPWVVAISAFDSGEGYYWGSGIVMTQDGYILTNNHIIENTSSVTVTLFDDSVYEAHLVGADLRSDIAVLKIDAEGLPNAQFGDSSFLEVGEDVVAIGNPLGEEFRSTLTNGIISSTSRDVRHENFTMKVLQTTVALNEGNSGGPLINMYGQVVGITNMKMTSYTINIEGIAFAIPSSGMKRVVDDLIEQGYVSGRPAIGITPGGRTDYTLPDGLYVQGVDTNSDAYTKGIQSGDIIIAAQGVEVVSALDLNNIKDLLAVGDVIVLTIYRNGETFDVEVVMCDMANLEN